MVGIWLIGMIIISSALNGLPINYSDPNHPMFAPVHSPQIIVEKPSIKDGGSSGGCIRATNNATAPMLIKYTVDRWSDQGKQWHNEGEMLLQPGETQWLYCHGDLTYWYKSDLTITCDKWIVYRNRIYHPGKTGVL